MPILDIPRRATILLLMAAIIAAAQAPPAETLSLSMKQAVDLALSPDGNARVQLAQELIRQSTTRAAQARATLLPNADAAFTTQNFTRNLKAFGVTVPIPGFPEVVGPITTYDWRPRSPKPFLTSRRSSGSRPRARASIWRRLKKMPRAMR